MLAIPAIDLHQGQVVRLTQGDLKKCTVYNKDPVAQAEIWLQAGAERLHVVDLDGAFAGKPVNAQAIAGIAQKCLSHQVAVQVGGGIRSADHIEALLNQGVSQVILGTLVVEEPKFFESLARTFGKKIIVSLDTNQGQVKLKGWEKTAQKSLVQLLEQLQAGGLGSCFGLIHTDISRDGTLTGLASNVLTDLVNDCPVPVIAAGGVGQLKDLQRIKKAVPELYGVITGKSIYEGGLDLREAIATLSY